MIDSSIASLISTTGFPIFLCLWFMFRTEKCIMNNTEALNSIQDSITKCKKK